MPCRVWIASHCFPVWRPSHALDANNRGRESATHFLLLESIYREPFFYRRPAIPDLRARRSEQVVLHYPQATPKTRTNFRRVNLREPRVARDALPCRPSGDNADR